MPKIDRNSFFTPEEYLSLDRASKFKSEYYDRSLAPLTSVGPAHTLIAANLTRQIGRQIKGTPAELHGGMRIQGPTPRHRTYMYPDLVAVRAEPIFADDQSDTLLNPNLAIEIFAPSTEKWDKSYQRSRYKSFDSLVDHVLVGQMKVVVKLMTRRGREWNYSEYHRLEDNLRLDSIDCVVTLASIYANVRLRVAPPETV